MQSNSALSTCCPRPVVARYTSIAIRIEDEAIKSKKITGVLQIGNVDLMLEGIEGALGVRVNRVSPELVSLSAG